MDLTITKTNTKRITDLQLDVAKYEMDLEEKIKSIKCLHDSNAQKDQLIRKLQLKVNRMTFTVDDLHQQRSERDDKIRQLEV